MGKFIFEQQVKVLVLLGDEQAISSQYTVYFLIRENTDPRSSSIIV